MTFKPGDPVILTSDQPLLWGANEMPAGCIGYVNRITDTLVAIDFGGPFGTIWCDPKNVGAADAEYVARAWGTSKPQDWQATKCICGGYHPVRWRGAGHASVEEWGRRQFDDDIAKALGIRHDQSREFYGPSDDPLIQRASLWSRLMRLFAAMAA